MKNSQKPKNHGKNPNLGTKFKISIPNFNFQQVEDEEKFLEETFRYEAERN